MKHITSYRHDQTALHATGILLGHALLTPVSGDTTITMLSVAEVRGPQVLLREIVSDHDALPSEWGDRIVLQSPAPGKAENISISAIAYALQQYPDMKDVTLRGTPATTVRRAVATLDIQQITRCVESYVANNAPWDGAAVQVILNQVNPVRDLPAGAMLLKIISAEVDKSTPDQYLFQLAISVDGTHVRTVQIPARVLALKDVWVTQRPLRRGQIVTEEDVVSRTMPWQSDNAQYLSTDTSVAGFEVTRDVKQGLPLFRHILLPPVCAQMGDLINVIASQSGLTIKLQAKALSTGRRGDQIQCVNENSKRRFLVRLTDIKTAVVQVPETIYNQEASIR